MNTLPARFDCMPTDELHAYCAAAAVHLLREREAKYPIEVEKRRMAQQASADGLERMRCIVAQWRWVIDPARPPLPSEHVKTGRFGCHVIDLDAEMQHVAERSRARAAADPVSWEKEEMANLCEALAYYQRRYIGGDPVILVHLYARGGRDDWHE